MNISSSPTQTTNVQFGARFPGRRALASTAAALVALVGPVAADAPKKPVISAVKCLPDRFAYLESKGDNLAIEMFGKAIEADEHPERVRQIEKEIDAIGDKIDKIDAEAARLERTAPEVAVKPYYDENQAQVLARLAERCENTLNPGTNARAIIAVNADARNHAIALTANQNGPKVTGFTLDKGTRRLQEQTAPIGLFADQELIGTILPTEVTRITVQGNDVKFHNGIGALSKNPIEKYKKTPLKQNNDWPPVQPNAGQDFFD